MSNATLHDELLGMFHPYEHFCRAMLDAYAIVTSTGKVIKSNPLLSQIVGISSKQILKLDSLNDVMRLSVAGDEWRIDSIAQINEPTRIDEIKCEISPDRNLNLIIGVYPFVRDGVTLGAFLLIRDVTAETQLQDKYKIKATQSITDKLTGLFNRAYFDDYLQSQDEHLRHLPANSDHRKLAICMFDIDHFKKINDVHGHPAGDFIIKTVASILMRTFRGTDIACRYGGEEFLVILPACDLSGAYVAADKARMAIESHAFEFENAKIPVTISSGVAQFKVGSEPPKELINRADAALYASKHNGRNRVSMHDGSRIVLASNLKIHAA